MAAAEHPAQYGDRLGEGGSTGVKFGRKPKLGHQDMPAKAPTT